MSAPSLWQKRWQRFLENGTQWRDDMMRDLLWYLRGRHQLTPVVNEIIAEHQWCFIVGCNNSGTSVLQTLLERSGQVTTHDREGQFYTRVLTRGQRRGYERVWTEFLDEVRMTERDSLAQVPRLVHDWLLTLPQPRKPIILEKTTLNAVRMRWLQQAFPRSYFIGLVRNGYAVSEGIMRKGNKSAQRAGHHWNQVNQIMLEDAHLVDHFLQVKYEDIIGNPKKTATQIEKFLGLESKSLTKSLDTSFSFETLEGTQTRSLTDFNEKSIARLSDREIETISCEAGAMLDQFGYRIKR